jgi:ceramide glucosyltransferase
MMFITLGIILGSFIFLHFFAFAIGLNRCRSIKKGQEPPGISVIKPVKGLDAGAYENFASFCVQELTVPYELIFSFQDPQDPALPLVRKLQKDYPQLDIRVTVNPVKTPMTGKSSNLHYGIQMAKYDCLILSDADMRVEPDFVARIASQLNNPKLGLVSALPIHVGAKGFWALIYMLQLNATILAQWLPYATLFKLGVAGGTIAIKKQVIEEIGGMEAIGDYLVEDVKLGLLVKEAGYQVAIGPEIYSPVGAKTKQDAFSLLARGAIIYRKMLHLALEIPYLAVAYFYFPMMLLGLVLMKPTLILAGVIHLSGKMLTAFMISRRAGTSGVETFLLPVMDGLFLFVYLQVLRTGTLTWRGMSYRVDEEGRQIKVS